MKRLMKVVKELNHKRLISLLLVACLFVTALSFSTVAVERPQQTVTYFDDGSYVVTTITEIAYTSQYSLTQSKTKSASKNRDFYDANDELIYSLTVYGTFTYDGTTAEATSATYSYDTHGSGWSFKSGSASCSGATAKANATFKNGLLTGSASVSLTCSPTGVLS